MLAALASMGSCTHDQQDDANATEFREEPLPAEPSAGEPEDPDVQHGVVDDFVHPLEALADMHPTPIFEVKNDPEGKRYAFGEGREILTEGEDAEVVELPSLVVWERRAMTGEELEAARSVGPALELPSPTKLGTELVALASADDDSPVDVVLMGSRTFPGLQAELDRRIATGVIRSKEDFEMERELLLEERREIIAEQLEVMETGIEAAGGSVISTCIALPCMTAILRPSSFAEIAELDEVARMDWADVPGSATGPDGQTMRQGAQVQAYLDNGWDGEGATSDESDDVVVGILEHVQVAGTPGNFSFLTTHQGYRDAALDVYRWADVAANYGWRWDCTVTPCDHTTFPYSPGSHSTGITGVIIGDLTEGQHPDYDDPTEQERASGFAPEARVHMLLMNNSTRAINAIDAMIDAAGTDDPPQVMNMSFRFGYTDGCSGADVLSQTVNNLYLDGIATFAAAGNEGGSAASCTVNSPGAALASFTVGAHHQDTGGGTPLDVRTAPIYWETGEDDPNQSSWGGNATQGQNRSIISLTRTRPAVVQLPPGRFDPLELHERCGVLHESRDRECDRSCS
ncbi:MAG TPA: S8 family serine peptidase [Nannocystaceae bacterium]|nr:S8 family serine peptidase [Nannocystaceae bacterium]